MSQGFEHLDKGDTFQVDTTVQEASEADYDAEVVVDNGLVSSRKPDELPAFCGKLAEEICEGRHAGQRAGAVR